MMAAGGELGGELGDEAEDDPDWQQIEKEIKCPICEKVFTHPKTTPCLHTFCKECLETTIETARASPDCARCPLCRQVLQQRSLTGYPNDFRVNRLIEIFNNHVKAKKVTVASAASSGINPFHGCGKCEENVPVVSWCAECQVLLCNDCKEIHGKWKEFKMHNTVTLEEYVKHSNDFMPAKQQPARQESR